MATYAIGDIQGCFSALQRLINQIQFDPGKDRLWFVGDLVNRGPDSLRVLRYIKGLGPVAMTVLGNHDLFLLAAWAGVATLRPTDTIQGILDAPDCKDLLEWLRRQPLLHREGRQVLVHAGLLPQWTVAEAETLAREVEGHLQGSEATTFLRAVFETKGIQWSDNLTGIPRAVAAIKVLTRLRVCKDDGTMDSAFTGPPDMAPAGYHPWFTVPNRRHGEATIICGHWAALGLHIEEKVLALDSGCVWGRDLTAVRLEDRLLFQVSCQEHQDRRRAGKT